MIGEENMNNKDKIPIINEEGEEKGYFEFGGSSIMLLLEKDRFVPDEDLVINSRNQEETVVKQGEAIGTVFLD